ncbi:MAG: helix-turn-helix domain-containing protein [Synechococcus sp.]
MTSTTCVIATLLAVLTIPLLLLWRATESKNTTARRLRSYGWTWRQVGDRLGVSPTTARRWAMA